MADEPSSSATEPPPAPPPAGAAAPADDSAREASPVEEIETPANTAQDYAAALQEAREAKARGNTHFKAGEYDAAIECYTMAIDSTVNYAEADDDLAIFYANRAACFAKIGEHDAVVDDCTAALERKADYTKALLRRAAAREALKFPTEALEDAKRAAELEPDSKEATAAVQRLEKASAADLEAKKEEMLGQLKDLGNNVLGRFGMSLDNFKAQKDPATGSYNISFQQ